MLREAGEFSQHLRRCEKEIRGVKVATESLLTATRLVMTAPLPRVFDEMGGGKVVAVGAGAADGGAVVVPIGGLDFNAEELSRLSKETGRKLESEVLAPMERWMNAYALVQNRMKKLESLRLEVDSRRRTVSHLGRKVDCQRARLPQTRAKGEYEMEGTIKVLQHKESKLSACRQAFKEHEALVYHQLTNLIRDTVWLKSYLSAVLRVQSEAFGAANAALGQMKAALPALPAPSSARQGDASVVGSQEGEAERGAGHPATALPGARVDVALGGARGKQAFDPVDASKDSLYTLSDAPAAPTTRIPAVRL